MYYIGQWLAYRVEVLFCVLALFLVIVCSLKQIQLSNLGLSKTLISVLFYSKMKGSDNQEKLVYQIIEDAGNKGTLLVNVYLWKHSCPDF